tara:strand:+ start:937 stop:1116 length:180 start_codon:yes stop_codon:yes gene_type:complete
VGVSGGGLDIIIVGFGKRDAIFWPWPGLWGLFQFVRVGRFIDVTIGAGHDEESLGGDDV